MMAVELASRLWEVDDSLLEMLSLQWHFTCRAFQLCGTRVCHNVVQAMKSRTQGGIISTSHHHRCRPALIAALCHERFWPLVEREF